MAQPDFLDPAVWEMMPEEVQEEVLRQGEMRVHATQGLAQAADQRAVTTMGVLGAVAVALLAAAATLISAGHPDWLLISAPASVALGLIAAAAMSAKAMAPVDFMPPGAQPSRMFEADISDRRRFRAALIHSAERAIDYNKERILCSSRWFKGSLWLALLSVLVGLALIGAWAAVRRLS
jgi:hypothetical protein